MPTSDLPLCRRTTLTYIKISHQITPFRARTRDPRRRCRFYSVHKSPNGCISKRVRWRYLHYTRARAHARARVLWQSAARRHYIICIAPQSRPTGARARPACVISHFYKVTHGSGSGLSDRHRGPDSVYGYVRVVCANECFEFAETPQAVGRPSWR